MSLKSKESSSLVLVAAKAGKEGSYTISITPDTISHQIGTQVTFPEMATYFSFTGLSTNRLLRDSNPQNGVAKD